jgi:hypothetical protein
MKPSQAMVLPPDHERELFASLDRARRREGLRVAGDPILEDRCRSTRGR